MSLDTGNDTEVHPCAQCQSPVFHDELYCEACGRRVAPEPPTEQPLAPRRRRDRDERDLGLVAGITDRGARRQRNEDALEISEVDGRVVVAVCDGVASTANPDQAAKAAAAMAFAVAEPLLYAPEWPPSSKLEETLREAFHEAQVAVTQIPDDEPGGNNLSPSTTMVVALVGQGRVTVGSVGDSRAYWLGTHARLLTVDDSLAQEQIAEGIAPEVAYAHPEAHTITRWIGADADSADPSVVTMEVAEQGLLVLCTDGLWNYFEEPERLHDLVSDMDRSAPIEIARRLTDAALEAGGQDNITVVVIPIDPVATGTGKGHAEG